MQPLDAISWILLSLAFLSVWVRHSPKIWGTLFALSVSARIIDGTVQLSGLALIVVLAVLWSTYVRKKNAFLYLLIIAVSYGFIFHLFPGFTPTPITPHFQLSFDKSMLGLFPLALVVPLAKHIHDWQKVIKGLVFGCIGIVLLALLAVSSAAIGWEYELPTFPLLRYAHNLILVAIPEEALFRGFIQRQLAKYLKNTKRGKAIALIITAILFTFAHLYWAPSLDILAFVFLAGLLYGGVYLFSEKIESAILCHFLLNAVHMSCFSYHAM